MYNFPIGVITNSFRTGPRTAIAKAAEMGADGVQMYAAEGACAPENMSPQQRRELLDYIKSYGLRFSALCGDLGMGFHNKELNPQLIERSKRILDLAKDLETDIVTTHIGVVPEDKSIERYSIMQEACYELAAYADSIGSHFAIETGPETSKVLKGFLDSLGSTGVAVNLDPANLVMVVGDDPVEAVHNLKDYIVHTHAKDGRRVDENQNPTEVYHAFAVGGVDALNACKGFAELPLGEGDVDWPKYLQALQEIGYDGFLTIERECGENPVDDIEKAVEFLQNQLKQ